MPHDTAAIIVLTVAYVIISSITTFDTRLIQGKKNGTLPADEPGLPKWTAILYWLEWIIFAVMFYLNWRYALIVFAVKFALKLLPVLEIIGNILMLPLKKK